MELSEAPGVEQTLCPQCAHKHSNDGQNMCFIGFDVIITGAKSRSCTLFSSICPTRCEREGQQFLGQIYTYDETWLHYFDPDSIKD
jgi:hypothetical protein